jgi:hypothetical protein
MNPIYVSIKTDGAVISLYDITKVEYAQLEDDTSYTIYINGTAHKHIFASKADRDKNWAFVCNTLDKLNKRRTKL